MFKYLKRTNIIGIMIIMTLTLLVSPLSEHQAKAAGPDINAKSAILIDAETGKILYSKNVDTKLPPASMSKIMTEYLVNKYIAEGKLKWDSKVTVGDYANQISNQPDYSKVPLRPDYQYTVRELYEGMAISSANGATIALAAKIAGSEKEFVKIMNNTADKLGMEKAEFVNSTGLNNSDLLGNYHTGNKDDGNSLSARALAKLAYHFINEYYVGGKAQEISSTAVKNFKAGIEGQPFKMVNVNWMLPGFSSQTQNMSAYEYKGVDGLKTGYTNLAKYCFTGTVEQNGRRLISVVMGTDSKSARFLETKKLYDYGFNQFEQTTIVKDGYQFKDHKNIPVLKGKEDHVGIEVKGDIKTVVSSGQADNFKPVLHLDQSKLNDDGELTAPVKKGDKVGYVTLKYTGDQKQSGYLYKDQLKAPVVVADDVDKANWFVLTFRSVGHFFSGLFSSAVDFVTGLF
ncbi:D-alanyl-D-alanine carboxypeptidase family protein [Tuberibacillus sp. Marseille-P3662]|uniref:D-alanyl-D-alanine carboxypeptidase family protein n=1 Tax=Tuberibacillus sp. Marseille-P3662 TaxID=1965358 RepID=UPI000A1C9DDC|nr:D-alanyl-D-alanine carboxypeptidase family protein [Tuberibacillus sp. Marseille-P3662]